jgi:hypothetical protein
MMKSSVIAVGLIVTTVLLIGTAGCKNGKAPQSPPRKQPAEYDCHKHAKDKICEVPWKDKIVLYCYANPKLPRVVRYREDCK